MDGIREDQRGGARSQQRQELRSALQAHLATQVEGAVLLTDAELRHRFGTHRQWVINRPRKNVEQKNSFMLMHVPDEYQEPSQYEDPYVAEDKDPYPWEHQSDLNFDDYALDECLYCGSLNCSGSCAFEDSDYDLDFGLRNCLEITDDYRSLQSVADHWWYEDLMSWKYGSEWHRLLTDDKLGDALWREHEYDNAWWREPTSWADRCEEWDALEYYEKHGVMDYGHTCMYMGCTTGEYCGRYAA